MAEELLSRLSEELEEIDSQIEEIDKKVNRLRKQRQDLINKKNQIERKIDARNNEDNYSIVEKWDRDGFEWSDQARLILQKNFQLKEFRPLQRAAINAVMSKQDALVIMSTGGGKSLCYQLPSLLSKGLTLVVSPLISLIEDQIHQLRKLGIDSACLNASTTKDEVKRVEEAITNAKSNFRLLYVTPEKLAKSKRIMNKLEKSLSVGFLKLIAIDEVHCCSQWGHDFRTDYAFLNVLKRQFKGVPILGLTATATSSVVSDIKDMLGIPSCLVFRIGFNRRNLIYEVRNKAASEDESVKDMADLIKSKFANSCGIIYCLSRNDCEKVAKSLKNHGIKAKHYHAYMEPAERSQYHQMWLDGRYQVIVATVAFGMGIDKPNVRFVFHHSIPKSIENYYQESGRAGRDGEEAWCILFHRFADIFKQSTMVQHEKAGIPNLYSIVRYATESMRCRRAHLAEHFEEDWEVSWCQQHCDVCSKGAVGRNKSVNVFEVAERIIGIIDENKAIDKNGSGRITANKLVQLLSSKLKKSKEYCEHVVTQLLLNGYLQEEFHYTVYSVISYISAGHRWSRVKDKNVQIPSPPEDGGSMIQTTRKRKRLSNKEDDKQDSDDDDDDIVYLE